MHEADARTAVDALRNGGEVVDVRDPATTARDPLAGARRLPLEAIQQGAAPDDLPRDAPLYLVCERGLLSELAALYLRDAGYDARNVRGGLRAMRPWLDDGDPGTGGNASGGNGSGGNGSGGNGSGGNGSGENGSGGNGSGGNGSDRGA